ncbi:uncharacterized protein LOC135091982 [Scylla paramamosain]|uniref:uncharacterized protein LOC135091982 n=1 Tax=Scylla paramamosain TaxID=85552 RepID=UPI003083868F
MTTPPPCSCHGARTCRPTQECVRGGFAASGTRAYALYSCVFRAWQVRRKARCKYTSQCPFLCLLLLLLLLRTPLLVAAATEVPVIQCECSTADCAAAGVTTCTTASLCYFQHFDHHDGSHPITRGCITSGSVNSLQCLNLHQAARRSFWPYVVCCGTDYCNRDLMPPLPTTYFPVQDDDGDDGDDEDDGSLLHHYLRVASHHSATTTTNTTKGHHKLPRLNTVCLVVIGAAVAFMVTISIASLCILIRCRSTYTRAPQEPLDVGMEKLKTMEPSAPPLVFAYHPASP